VPVRPGNQRGLSARRDPWQYPSRRLCCPLGGFSRGPEAEGTHEGYSYAEAEGRGRVQARMPVFPAWSSCLSPAPPEDKSIRLKTTPPKGDFTAVVRTNESIEPNSTRGSCHPVGVSPSLLWQHQKPEAERWAAPRKRTVPFGRGMTRLPEGAWRRQFVCARTAYITARPNARARRHDPVG
jgi:hypothetical protein